MLEDHDERGPATAFERNFYVFTLTVILALFGAEIIHDFHPIKLSILFFVLFWPALLVLHEAGHALMADLLGWQVRLMVIGFGREMWRLHWFRFQVIIRTVPLSGYVIPAPRNLKWPRLKLALIYLAGPGIELMLLVLLVGLIGPEVFLSQDPERSVGVIALQSLGVTILAGVVINLIPVPFQTAGGTAVSDGLGFLRSFILPREHFVALMGSRPEDFDEGGHEED
jgi:membrane-associated protease RseP (regulator of RpoE activity)